MLNRFENITTFNTIIQSLDNFFTVLDNSNSKAFICTTIFFSNDNVLGYVNETTSQVTGVSCPKRCIRQTFTGTVSR
ncbi:hypothetical protein D3C78_1167580 [compost metagenome]